MFGDIVNDQMRLNEAGFIVRTWWQKVGGKFSSVQTDRYIIIPNHFHGIVNVKGQPHGVAPPLGDIVNWFKTMTTNEYIRGVKQEGWSPFGGKLWQRNYYEHIIRDEEELNHIRQYIAENPLNWGTDEENPDVTFG